jgi:hypothetical protein
MTGARRAAAVVVAAVVAAVLGAAGPALADGKPPSERDRQAASELVKKAIARSQAGDTAAIKVYLRRTLVPNSLLLSNIGAEFNGTACGEALDYL